MNRSPELSRQRKRWTGYSSNRAVHRRRPPRFLPRSETVEDRMLLATLLWTGGAGDNNWDAVANWVNAAVNTDHHVPTAGDDAVIDSTYTDVSSTTIAVNGSDAVHSLDSQASL